jgi:hypothetical protein
VGDRHEPTPGTLVCGSGACTGNTECCAIPTDGGVSFQCLASCPDGGAPFECDSPQQCPSGMNACCGTLQLAGVGEGCSFGAESSACAATCTSMVVLSCPYTELVQFCAQKADCTDPFNANCCTLTLSGRAETFCLSDSEAQAAIQLLGAQCLQ